MSDTGWYDVFVAIGLLVMLVLAVVAVIFLGRLDDIDTDDATLSVISTAAGSSLSNSPNVVLQFVSPGNGVMMSLKTFSGTLVGANSFLATQTPISDDFWPPFDVTFPILVQNNATSSVGRLVVLSTGILQFYPGPGADLFVVGSVTVSSTGVSWTQPL